MKLPTLTTIWIVCILTCYEIQTVQGKLIRECRRHNYNCRNINLLSGSVLCPYTLLCLFNYNIVQTLKTLGGPGRGWIYAIFRLIPLHAEDNAEFTLPLVHTDRLILNLILNDISLANLTL